MNDGALGARLRRVDPELAKERKLLAPSLPARADRQTARRKTITLAAAEKAKIARPEKRNHLVHDMGRVERIVQAKSGKPQIDRQAAFDLVVSVVEQIGRIRNRRGQSVAQDIDGHRPLVKMAQMEQLQPERPAWLPEQQLVRLEANIAPGVEAEARETLGKRRNLGVERRRGQIARPLDHVVIAERGRRLARLGGLLGDRRSETRARCDGDSGEQRATADVLHGVRSIEAR